MKIYILLSIALIVSLTGCNNASDKTTADSNGGLPPIEVSQVTEISQVCILADVIFENYGISMGLDNAAAIRSNLGMIAAGQSVAPNQCPADARIIYSTADDMIAEMDVYITNGCLHVTLLEQGQAVAASPLTEQGANFYSKIVRDYINQNQ